MDINESALHANSISRGDVDISDKTLRDIVEAWRQRKILCEDVDMIENHGGQIRSSRHRVAARRPEDAREKRD